MAYVVRISESVPYNFIEESSSLTLKLLNQHLIQGRLVKASQTLIWNFPICIGDMVKAQFGLFLFSKTQNNSSTGAKKKNCLRCQFTVMILCLTVRPWDWSQNHESHDKSARLDRYGSIILLSDSYICKLRVDLHLTPLQTTLYLTQEKTTSACLTQTLN